MDRLIHATVMTSYAADTMWIGAEDRRFIAEARSILVDAEAALLRDDSTYRCTLGLRTAADRLRYVTDGRKRNIQHGNVQRGLDARVRAELDAVRAGCERLASELSERFAKGSRRG